MPKRRIPKSNEWVRSNEDFSGDLIATKGIDLFSVPGKIRLSERMYSVLDSDDDADVKIPFSFVRTDAFGSAFSYKYVALMATSYATPGVLFKTSGDSALTGWTQDATASTPTGAIGNMVVFGRGTTDRLIVPNGTSLSMLDNGTWTSTWLSLNTLTDSAHQLYVFLNLLIIPEGNTITTIDDSSVITRNRLIFPKDYFVTWVADDGNRVYFGTWNKNKGDALVFPWDGTSETYDKPLRTYDDYTYAGVNLDGILYIMNGKGQLLGNSGGALVEVSSLPCMRSPYKWNDGVSPRFVVNPQGMKVIDGEIHVLVEATVYSATTGMYQMPSGIWVRDKRTGSFYQKYSIGQYDGTTDNDWGAPTIAGAGALMQLDNGGGHLLAGASVWKDATTELYGVFASKETSSVSNRGHFITTKINSADVNNFWTRLQYTYKKLKNSTDRIIVKYRTEDSSYVDDVVNNSFVITWSDTDTFTTTASFASNISVGDEIEIMRGKGSGALAHVSSISVNAGTYTINLDEAIPNVSGTARARFLNFKKLGTVSDQTTDKRLETIIKESAWIQFRFELRGDYESPEINDLLLEYKQRTI